MFSNLTDLSFNRTRKQAFGFYLAFLLLIILGGALLSGVAGFMVSDESTAFGNGVRLGALFAIISCVGLSFAILHAKKLTNQFGLMLLAVVAGILALIGGGVLGLIIPAVFTTKNKKK